MDQDERFDEALSVKTKTFFFVGEYGDDYKLTKILYDLVDTPTEFLF